MFFVLVFGVVLFAAGAAWINLWKRKEVSMCKGIRRRFEKIMGICLSEKEEERLKDFVEMERLLKENKKMKDTLRISEHVIAGYCEKYGIEDIE